MIDDVVFANDDSADDDIVDVFDYMLFVMIESLLIESIYVVDVDRYVDVRDDDDVFDNILLMMMCSIDRYMLFVMMILLMIDNVFDNDDIVDDVFDYMLFVMILLLLIDMLMMIKSLMILIELLSVMNESLMIDRCSC